MSRIIGYGCILAAAIGGFVLAPSFIILILALISTAFMVRGRMEIDKDKVRAAKPNPVADGAFLFAAQVMIMFIVYLVGYFAGSEGGAYFVDFLKKGGRA